MLAVLSATQPKLTKVASFHCALFSTPVQCKQEYSQAVSSEKQSAKLCPPLLPLGGKNTSTPHQAAEG